ncbi:MAG TPA: nuclear transport factor 2 family protein [Solirubrobacterales bacterium]|nr:nuclear transport factor 2 family protein [Solirubrobacterales bacterium]
MEREALLTATYEAFNARDIDSVLATMHPEVDWPNAWEGGRVHGHEEVRDYWTRQWAQVDPRVSPIGFEERGDGRVAVAVRQVVRDRDGNLLAENEVVHVYAFGDDLITAMEVEEPG